MMELYDTCRLVAAAATILYCGPVKPNWMAAAIAHEVKRVAINATLQK